VEALARITLHDTMKREVRVLEPEDGEVFRFYCCGPTVYGPAHIGNFRSFVMQDVFRRTLESAGIRTRHIRNVTDVDDKTIRQSCLEGVSLEDFTAQWTERFHADCEALNVLPPHVEPGAVAHIPEQIGLIQILMEKGHAYRSEDGSVYYRIASFPSYGALSRLHERTITTPGYAPSAPESPAAPAGPAWSDEYERESAADFALWKAYRPEDGPNRWQSPWGEGRPGWHIECSAMSMKYLGPTFDLHGGGVDLIFPHHENEIAQSEAATGKTFVRHWFHVAHLLVEGRKMSKSLGNLFTLGEVRSRGFTPEELRYVLLAGHYRQPLNFTWDSLQAARSALGRLRDLRSLLSASAGLDPETPPAAPVPPSAADFGEFLQVFEAMARDLGTPDALGKLFTVVRSIQRRFKDNEPKKAEATRLLLHLDSVLWMFGFTLPAPEKVEAPQKIREMAEQRWLAKREKRWADADTIRAEISAAGWTIKDSATGYEILPGA
jgi:cysteinyl-tRNA synthetase